METTIWLEDERVEVWCVGHVTFERSGYYAGCADVDNFKVFSGNDNVTAKISKDELKALIRDYAHMAENEGDCA